MATANTITIKANTQEVSPHITPTTLPFKTVDVIRDAVIAKEQTRVNTYLNNHKITNPGPAMTGDFNQAKAVAFGFGDLLSIPISRAEFIKALRAAGNAAPDNNAYQRTTEPVILSSGGKEYFFRAGSRFFLN